MIGIDLDKFGNLLEKNKLYYQSVKDDSMSLCSSIRSLADTYSGKTLDSIFLKTLEQVETIKDINNYLASYFTLLESVRKSYVLQDINFARQLNNISPR